MRYETRIGPTYTYLNRWIYPCYWGTVWFGGTANIALTQSGHYLAGAVCTIAIMPICVIWGAVFRLHIYYWYHRVVVEGEQG